MKQTMKTDLLAKLSLAGVKLWVEEGKLRYRAPKGVLTSQLRTELEQNKVEILAQLSQPKQDPTSSLPQIIPAPKQKHLPFPLTDIQQAYLIGRSKAFELGNIASHYYFEMEAEELDLERFSIALNKVIQRHDMLRAVILPDGKQQILEQVPFYQIPILDLRRESPDKVTSQLANVRESMSQQMLPTDRCPIFEIRASILDDRRVRLHLGLDLIVADAWSCYILLREVDELYQNPQASLTSFELSFRDYVLALDAFKDSELYQNSLNYWQKRLPKLPPAPGLPLAKNPSAISRPRFTRRSLSLNPETWIQLKKRAAQSGVTSSGLLCAAFAEVLALWSDNSLFTLNITVFSRLPLHQQVKQIIGDFTTTVLLGIDKWHGTFFDRVKHLQEQLWEDLDNSYVNGVQMLRELARNRQSTVGAAMPVVFTSNLFGGEVKGQNFFPDFLSLTYAVSQTPQVFLDHQVTESDGTLYFSWDAVEELFPPGLLDDMFDTYCHLLEKLAWDEQVWHKPIINLTSINHPKPQLALSTTTASIAEELLYTGFLAQVRERAQHNAVVTPHQTLTYEQLSHRAHKLAHRLRKLGACPNTLVGVVMDRGWEQVVATLGILLSGAAYLPIDPELPQERQWHLLKEGGVKILLTQSWLDRSLMWPEKVQRLCLDSEPIAEESNQPLKPAQKPEDLAYVIYTSGSTGLPKGVTINHRGAVNTIIDVNQRFSISSDDRILALSSLSFDLSVYDIFGTLAAGGTIIIPEASRAKDPNHWTELLVEHQVTVWNSVPALMQMLVEHLTGCNDVVLNSLRVVLLSGDWIPLTLPERIWNLSKYAQIISLGGATEASIWSIFYPISAVNPNWKSIPYGQSLTNQIFYVFNEALKPCPVWVPGSLYIGGVGLAKGYWQNEEKTRTSFIIHPDTGERLYRTGDRGRYLPDGNIEFIGREDFQVKVKGHRIELGEIEATLAQHPAVETAVVNAIGEKQEQKTLVAYILPNTELVSPISKLRSFLSDKLPNYMVPSFFILLDKLPLTPNGKVDRKALPLPNDSRPELENTFVAPRTSLEESLTGFWVQILGIKQVGIYDNFFELGGNSLEITELMVLVRETLEVELPLVSFFDTPTIAGLAEVINIALQEGYSKGTTGITTTDLSAEAILEEEIYPHSLPTIPTTKLDRIFLTGATGFLGTYLLYELLEQTQAVIYCLVRSSSIAEGKTRIESKLKSHYLWNENFALRIIPVLGDLSQPRLGLSDEQFQFLISSIDSIYHNAAVVNFVYPYSKLKASNVLATQEIINLACQVKIKPIHFISTVDVFPTSKNSEFEVVYEKDSIDHGAILYGGYSQSKWVAEKLLDIASDRGLPVCIYRPGMIIGHSQTGICSTNDLLSTGIKGSIQLGTAPDLNIMIDMIPVDYASQSIVHLSKHTTSLKKVFHLASPSSLYLNQLFGWIDSLGYPLKLVSYEKWTSELKVRQKSLESSFRALMPMFLSEEEMTSGLLKFDNQNTLNGLKNSDIICPPISPELLCTQFSYFIKMGFLKAPKNITPLHKYLN